MGLNLEPVYKGERQDKTYEVEKMKKKNYIIATLLVSALLVGGIGIASAYQGNYEDSDEDGTPNGIDQDYERPMDGSNSPWVTGDERLERFQERFDLSDEQVEQIKEEIEALSEDELDHEEIEVIVEKKLNEFDVEEPELGGPRQKARGQGQGKGGNRRKGRGQGNYGDCPYAG